MFKSVLPTVLPYQLKDTQFHQRDCQRGAHEPHYLVWHQKFRTGGKQWKKDSEISAGFVLKV